MPDSPTQIEREEPVPVQEKPKRGAAKQSKPRFLICSDKVTGGLFDQERNLRIPGPGLNPVQVNGEIRKGSWLDCQIKAGLVTEL